MERSQRSNLLGFQEISERSALSGIHDLSLA